jgi:iron complex transport system substrate-binding protein
VSRTFRGNAGALAVALAASGALAITGDWGRSRGAVREAGPEGGRAGAPRPVPLPGGGWGLVDATGEVVPLRPYRRIVSTSMMTDRLLVELAEPDRVLAFSTAGARQSPWSYQFAGKPAIDGLGSVEAMVALKPDLVLASSVGGIGRVARLRAAGIEVFDLGQLRGLATLVRVSETLALLLGHPERGVRFARAFERRLGLVAAPLGDRPRRRGLYVAVIGPNLYGGTRGTSYHDVLVSAGLDDVAAARFADWTKYSAEQILEMGPEVLVTKRGMGASLCAFPGLDRLPACLEPGRIFELEAGLLDEPGPAMLDAAEALFALAYPGQDAARSPESPRGKPKPEPE